jgi:hypothetical protein
MKTLKNAVEASALLIGLGLSLLQGTPSFAQASENSAALRAGWNTYSSIPLSLRPTAFLAGWHPDAQGFMAHNALEHKWLRVEFQSGATIALIAPALVGNAKRANQLWVAIAVAFQHQNPDGSFDLAPTIDGKRVDPHGEPTAAAFFIAGLASAILVLEESPLAPQYATRIAEAKSRLGLAVADMSRPQRVAEMIRSDDHTLNRLLDDAQALMLGGFVTGDNNAITAGQKLLRMSLALQFPNGILLEDGGGDSSYQAVSIAHLCDIAMYMDSAEIMPALDRAAAWELSRITEDGRVETAGNTRTGLKQELYFGHYKGVDTGAVVRGLAEYAAISHNAAAEQAAEAVSTRLQQDHARTK